MGKKHNLKWFICPAVAMATAVLLFSCLGDRSDEDLDREIITSVIWQETRSDEGGSTAEYLYEFSDSGTLYLYSVTDNTYEEEERTHYIMSDKQIVIQNHGLFDVTRLTVDEFFFGDREKTVELYRYRGDIELPDND